MPARLVIRLFRFVAWQCVEVVSRWARVLVIWVSSWLVVDRVAVVVVGRSRG
ncbi:MAG: hypothetical protein ACYC3K_04820 [Candidatus Nanopelagicales bacterium]